MRNKFFIIFSILALISISGCSLLIREQSETIHDETKILEEENQQQEEQNKEEPEEETGNEEDETDNEIDSDNGDENGNEDNTGNDDEDVNGDDPVTDEEETEDNFNGEGQNNERVQFEDISFLLPENVEPLELGDQELPMIGYLLNRESGANFNIVMEPLPIPLDLDSYIEIATSVTGFDYESITNYEHGGIEWNEAISKQSGLVLNQRTFIHDNKAYVFSFASLETVYEDWLKVFEEVTNSVVIE